MTCRCTANPCTCAGQATGSGCQPPGGYGPGQQLPEHTPPPEGFYPCSTAVAIQRAVDIGRGVAHQQGFRPYRVFLVWQERAPDRTWRTAEELELYPVLVKGLSGVGFDLDARGLADAGSVTLEQVSPAQVDAATLQGGLRGQPWGSRTADQEFFYEIRQHPRCPSDPPVVVGRYVHDGVPEYVAPKSMWKIRLADQDFARDGNGNDQTVPLARALRGRRGVLAG